MPPIFPKKEDKKDNIVNANTGSVSDISGTDKDDDFNDNSIKNVTLGDFNKFVRIQDTLEKSIEKRNMRNQPGVSFGEKLGMKIEEKVSDTFIDKMLGGMFNIGGTSSVKPGGWLEIVKTVLDSGFAQQAGAKLPETIAALSKTIGPQKTEQLADAVVNAVNPKKSVEDEQRKMEEFVISLNPVNIVDVNKFMDLVNANSDNVKITDVTQARNILIEEQDRIRINNPMLAKQSNSPGQRYLEENRDMNRGQRFPSKSHSGINNDFFDGRPGNTNIPMSTPGNGNQITPEEMLSIDSNKDESVIAYAWRKGPGQFDFNIDNLYDKSNKSNLEKVRSMLRREQDNLLKGVEQGQLPIEEQTEGIDSKWDNKDIGKKVKMNKDGEILVPPSVADSPVIEDGEVRVMKKSEFLEEIGMTPKEQQQPVVQSEDQNSMMILLQKMANNFDSGISELNSKLQLMENRINKIDEQPNQIIPEVDTIPDVEIIPEVDTIPEITMEENEENVEEDQKQEELENNDIENRQSIQPIDIEDTRRKGGRIKLPKSILDEPKEEKEEVQVQTQVIKHPKGSFGWLEEQKRLKEQKANRDKTN